MSRLRLRRAVLLVVLLAAACSSNDDTASAPTTTAAPASSNAPTTSAATTSTTASTTAAPTTTVSECPPPGDLSRPVQDRTFTTSWGEERTFQLSLPTGYDGSAPVPAVFNLHGAGSRAAEQYVYGNFIEQAEADGVILVLPEALARNDPDRRAWSPGAPGDQLDLDYIDELVRHLRTEYCIDSLHAAGMSSGGFMTAALACWADTPFEGFGAVTFAFHDTEACGDAGARPFIYFHGTDDQTVPFDGTDDGIDAAPVTAQAWAEHNGCDPEPVETRVSDEVRHVEWQGCDAPTEFYVVEGGGHTWPGSLPIAAFGLTTDDISASDLIWAQWFS